MKQDRLHVLIPPEQKQALERLAKRRGTNPSEIIRGLIEQELTGADDALVSDPQSIHNKLDEILEYARVAWPKKRLLRVG